jgi:4'-phosphopantetheinyl transferase
VALAAFGPAAAVLARPDLDASWLNELEAERAARLRAPEDRDAFVAAHLLVRLLAAEVRGTSAGTVGLHQRCDRCGGVDHGRPILDGPDELGVSLAHSGGWVAAAVAAHPVGVDVEDGRVRGGRLSPVEALHPAEHDAVRLAGAVGFRRQWTRRECLVKLGRLSLDETRGVDLSALPVDAPRGAGARLCSLDDLVLLDACESASGTVVAVAAVEGTALSLRMVGGSGRLVDISVTDDRRALSDSLTDGAGAR